MIPLQLNNELRSSIYEAVDNELLQYNKEIAFPIIAVMNAYVDAGEDIEILAVKQEDRRTEANFEKFKGQVAEFEESKGCTCNITVIEVPYNELIETHLKTFEKLIEHFGKGDSLYACMTYGSKPVPVVEMLALNYAYRAIEGTTLGCMVYGQYNHETNESKIYDVTSLFLMDEIVKKVADLKPANPLGYIKTILAIED